MNKTIKKWHIVDAVLTVILGSALHFVYEWFDYNKVVAVFGAVNESVWEHQKLLFWPFIIFIILEFIFFGKNLPDFFYAKAVSLVSGLFFVIAMFYTYTGASGKEWLFIDILLFVIGTIISFLSSYKILTREKSAGKVKTVVSIIIILMLISIFAVFTFSPPSIPLFIDQNNGSYGIL